MARLNKKEAEAKQREETERTERNRQEGRDSGDEEEEHKRKKRRIIKRKPLTPIDMRRPTKIEFAEGLFALANADILIPLSFFSNRSLRYIDEYQNEFTSTKVTNPDLLSGKKQFFVWSMIEMAKKLGADIDDGLEGVEERDFKECGDNRVRFEAEREALGEEGEYAMYLHDHSEWWQDRPDVKDRYRYWKPIEETLRKKFERQACTFNPDEYYLETRNAIHASETAAQIQKMGEALQERLSSLSSFEPMPTTAPSVSLNLISSPRKPSILCCIGCGHQGHSLKDHESNASLPKMVWARLVGKSLYTPEHKKICISWNVYSSCKPGCNDAHICSCCGGPHQAFSGKCNSQFLG
ncbi:hypothetical protein BT96DRAFT_188601 [Gymnopus androsaceus JB14]|uniref:Uncharacterized protein n=1 Tax=Gymnopus androsaceus JB14 TaxID=1447944 RepID=A0A6A4H9E6_9AGAR|nr:hypothetical protein BT96DRAFT_188601 [Gymnopus androsaceus JB14]